VQPSHFDAKQATIIASIRNSLLRDALAPSDGLPFTLSWILSIAISKWRRLDRFEVNA
jgi:hypothetical protein